MKERMYRCHPSSFNFANYIYINHVSTSSLSPQYPFTRNIRTRLGTNNVCVVIGSKKWLWCAGYYKKMGSVYFFSERGQEGGEEVNSDGSVY